MAYIGDDNPNVEFKAIVQRGVEKPISLGVFDTATEAIAECETFCKIYPDYTWHIRYHVKA